MAGYISYNIYSQAGKFMGVFEASDPVDAIHWMHLEAGVKCSIGDDDRLVFESEEAEKLAGNVEAWRVEEAEEDNKSDDEYCSSCGYDHNCNRCLMI